MTTITPKSPEAKKIKSYRNYIIFLALLGIGFSYYSIVVNTSKLKDPTYKALCDISESIQCSNVLTSSYSEGFGVLGFFLPKGSPLLQSNGVYGLFMYAAFGFMSIYPSKFLAKIQLFFAIIAGLVTIYLSFIMFVVLEEACVVCISTYVINFLLLILVIKYRKYVIVDYESQHGGGGQFSSFLDGKQGKKKV